MTLSESIQNQRIYFESGATRTLHSRREALDALDRAIRAAEPDLLAALQADLGKSAREATVSEFGLVLTDIAYARRHLRRWMTPTRVANSLLLTGSAAIVPEPCGSVLIISPWNYPFQLAVSPLVSALAAGNTAVIKPSELAPRTAAVLAEIVRTALPPERALVVTGGPETAIALLDERFDHIFYTGGSKIARSVLTAAAASLTPCTLELGGKSPCIVCADANLAVAARRIVWGKFLNAGQTCVAPDFVWADRRIAAPLLAALTATIGKFYGEDPHQSPDYGRIVSLRHFDRLQGLLGAGRIVCGGTGDRETRYLSPTLLADVPLEAPIMQEEIFGPILPVLVFDGLGEVLDDLRRRPTPLALYLFSESRSTQKWFLERTRSGGACINDTVVHLLNPRLPFGGQGESGMGASHGRAGFATFSHRRSILRRGTRHDTKQRYPPDRTPLRWIKRALPLMLR